MRNQIKPKYNGELITLMPKDKTINKFELWSYRTVNVPERFAEYALIKADDEQTKQQLKNMRFIKKDINGMINKYDGIQFNLVKIR